MGIKESVPAYLDPTLGLEDLLTGVTFASAGSGFDPVTAEITVRNLYPVTYIYVCVYVWYIDLIFNWTECYSDTNSTKLLQRV